MNYFIWITINFRDTIESKVWDNRKLLVNFRLQQSYIIIYRGNFIISLDFLLPVLIRSAPVEYVSSSHDILSVSVPKTELVHGTETLGIPVLKIWGW